jgi:hypothetical protein
MFVPPTVFWTYLDQLENRPAPSILERRRSLFASLTPRNISHIEVTLPINPGAS